MPEIWGSHYLPILISDGRPCNRVTLTAHNGMQQTLPPSEISRRDNRQPKRTEMTVTRRTPCPAGNISPLYWTGLSPFPYSHREAESHTNWTPAPNTHPIVIILSHSLGKINTYDYVFWMGRGFSAPTCCDGFSLASIRTNVDHTASDGGPTLTQGPLQARELIILEVSP